MLKGDNGEVLDGRAVSAIMWCTLCLLKLSVPHYVVDTVLSPVLKLHFQSSCLLYVEWGWASCRLLLQAAKCLRPAKCLIGSGSLSVRQKTQHLITEPSHFLATLLPTASGRMTQSKGLGRMDEVKPF